MKIIRPNARRRSVKLRESFWWTTRSSYLSPGAIGVSMTLPAARHTRDRLGRLLAKIPDPNA
jgi:hypothetical protein